jgi:hypothetical protein
MPYVQSNDKIKYQGRVYNIHLGPRGGKYIQMNGGMMSIARIPSMYRPSPELLNTIRDMLKNGIDEVFDACREKVNQLTVNDLGNALLILFDFNIKYKKVDKPVQNSCTCTPHEWSPIVPLPKQKTTVAGIKNKETQYMIACNFAYFLHMNLATLIGDQMILYPRNVFKNTVDDFIIQNSTEEKLREIMTDCDMAIDEKYTNLKSRLCSWHPMHDYIMTYVLKETPVGTRRRSSDKNVDTSKTFKIPASAAVVQRAPVVTKKSLLTEAIKNPLVKTPSASSYSSYRSSRTSSRSSRSSRQ